MAFSLFIFVCGSDGAQIKSHHRNLRWFAVNYCTFAYSALASFRMGMLGSASFHNVKKSKYDARALAVSPCNA